MKTARLLPCLAALALAAALPGCHKKIQTLQVPQTQAPPLNQSSITVITPLPSVPPSSTPAVEPTSTPKPVPQPVAKKTKPRRHRKHQEDKEQLATETKPPETVIPPPPNTDTVAAQWSTGTALDPKQRAQMLHVIQTQQKRLAGLRTDLSKDEQTIVIQIKLFLEKATDAVGSNDLDGAMTLTTKAQVLLDELQGTQP
jgi:hypothetical protein